LEKGGNWKNFCTNFRGAFLYTVANTSPKTFSLLFLLLFFVRLFSSHLTFLKEQKKEDESPHAQATNAEKATHETGIIIWYTSGFLPFGFVPCTGV